MSDRDIAQVCLNGHTANKYSTKYPESSKDYCDKCGQETISACPKCSKPIPGGYVDSISISPFQPPAHCIYCGAPYHWIESALQVAYEMIHEAEGISEDEKGSLIKSIPDIMVEGPRTELAATRFKRIISKIGGPVGGLLYKWSVDVASETAVKLIKGD